MVTDPLVRLDALLDVHAPGWREWLTVDSRWIEDGETFTITGFWELDGRRNVRFVNDQGAGGSADAAWFVARHQRLVAVAAEPLAPLDVDGVLQTVLGVVISVNPQVSHQGNAWCTADLATERGVVLLDVFHRTFAASGDLVTVGSILTVTGRVDRRPAGPARLLALAVSTSTPMVISTHNGSLRGRR